MCVLVCSPCASDMCAANQLRHRQLPTHHSAGHTGHHPVRRLCTRSPGEAGLSRWSRVDSSGTLKLHVPATGCCTTDSPQGRPAHSDGRLAHVHEVMMSKSAHLRGSLGCGGGVRCAAQALVCRAPRGAGPCDAPRRCARGGCRLWGARVSLRRGVQAE